MSDKMRWRYGDTNPVIAAVESATVIEIGDLVYQDGDAAKPATALPNQTSQSADQSKLADLFLGVAMQRSRAGDSEPIRVATTGVFEFDCASSTFRLGDLLGAEKNAGNTGLLSQQVAKVTLPKEAVGRVARREPTAATTVLVDIRSTVMTGGVEGSSYSA